MSLRGTSPVSSATKEPVWGEIDETVLRSSLHRLDQQLREKFGERYVKLILFGSRARGDHRPDSDADVAVIMREPVEDRWDLTKSVLDDTYDILLDTGLYIEPRLLDEEALNAPDKSANPVLVQEILRDGVAP